MALRPMKMSNAPPMPPEEQVQNGPASGENRGRSDDEVCDHGRRSLKFESGENV